MTRFAILKFDGTSTASATGWRAVSSAVAGTMAEGLRPVIVVPAPSRFGARLEGLLEAAAEERHAPILDAIERAYSQTARQMGVESDPNAIAPLRRLAMGVSLTGEWTPRIQARVVAFGPLLGSRLAAARLGARWIDAREALIAVATADDAANALAAGCDDAPDAGLAARFADGDMPIAVAGGVAADPEGRVVVLGPGGADASAALLAARLGAERCEIWSGEPGFYTADPREVPEARRLRRLDYAEAQEIATASARAVHPSCFPPLSRRGIPLRVGCTAHPELGVTEIGARRPAPAAVKAIAARRGVTLVSMETLGMWQQVGFLAAAFACFARHGVSVDLVSTSESNVTASLDAPPADLGPLLDDLERNCRARLIGPCAAVSLVGRGIRAILHRLGPALAAFEDRRIHLLSQAASDLNLTVVVDEDDAEWLVARLHALLFADDAPDDLGPAWRETIGGAPATDAAPTEPPWWIRRRDALLDVEATPTYAYDGAEVEAAASRLGALDAVDRVLYAMKANDHAELLRRIRGAGLGFECVSPGEIEHAFAACPDLSAAEVLYTPNFATETDYAGALERGVHVTVDNLQPLERWPATFAGRDLLLRLDPGRGRGHHQKVRTAGRQSKFGIAPEQLDAVARAVDACGARVVGLHAHVGSGIRDADAWTDVALFLAESTHRFPHVRVLDIGGGLGVREKPGQSPLDLSDLDLALGRVKAAWPDYALWMEPGRYLVAEAGVLLTRVVQVKDKGGRTYVGVDAGMNTLVRPALYGAWHAIVNLTRLGEPPAITADVVGPICETGDVLGHDRRLPATEPGDLMLIDTAGAYGRVMSSTYNRRPPPLEWVL